ncbi:hypothetical protein EMIT0P2_90136 [Pseudomonas sp. IT-P2]
MIVFWWASSLRLAFFLLRYALGYQAIPLRSQLPHYPLHDSALIQFFLSHRRYLAVVSNYRESLEFALIPVG